MLKKRKAPKRIAAKRKAKREALRAIPLSVYRDKGLKTSWAESTAPRISFFGHHSHRIASKMG